MSVCAPGPPLVAAIAAVEDVYGRDGVGVLEVVEKGARSLAESAALVRTWVCR